MSDDSQLPDTAPKVPDLSKLLETLPKVPDLSYLSQSKVSDPSHILPFAIKDLRRPIDPAITAGKMTIAAMQNFMSDEATYSALKIAVADIVKAVPADHDVVIEAFGIFVTHVSFMQPHTLILRGRNGSGHFTNVVAHYSQMIARVIYSPQQEPAAERVVTGFTVVPEPANEAS